MRFHKDGHLVRYGLAWPRQRLLRLRCDGDSGQVWTHVDGIDCKEHGLAVQPRQLIGLDVQRLLGHVGSVEQIPWNSLSDLRVVPELDRLISAFGRP